MKRQRRSIEVSDDRQRGKFRVSLAQPPEYDPEAYFRETFGKIQAPRPSPTSNVIFEISESSLLTGGKFGGTKRIEFRADTPAKRAVEAIRKVRQGGIVRKVFGRISEAFGARENFDGFDRMADGMLAQNPDQEFLQQIGGPFSRQMYLSAMLQEYAACFWEYHHNPLARRAISIKQQYTVGRGLKVKFRDPAMQEAWDEWWDRDHGFKRLRWASRDLRWQGELMWRLFMRTDKLLEVREVDPSTVWEVISYPADQENVVGFWQVFPGPFNIMTMPDPSKGGEVVPMSQYIIRMIPVEEMIHVKVNETYGEKRGRSDLYPSLSWGKRIRDYLGADVVAAMYERSFVWDVTLKGDQTDVDAATQNPQFKRSPRPGSVWTHNGAMEVKPMSATIGASAGRETLLRALTGMYAAGVGVPAEYLGFGGHETKASAISKTTPFVRSIEDDQLTLETDLIHEFARAMRDAYGRAGMFGVKPDTDCRCEVTWPEAAPEDTDVRIARIVVGRDSGWLKPETAASMYAAEMKITDYNAADEMAGAQKAKADAADQAIAVLDEKAAKLAPRNAPTSSAAVRGEKQADTSLKPKAAPGPKESRRFRVRRG